jgi:rhodanese-related sulfurtransferase
MKKLLIIGLSFLFLSCYYNRKIEEASVFDIYVARISEEKAVGYDIRSIKECEDGHIRGFMCLGESDNNMKSVEEIAYSIYFLYKQSNKRVLVIDNDGIKSEEVIAILIQQYGYKKAYYFGGGMTEYINQKGDDLDLVKGPCEC